MRRKRSPDGWNRFNRWKTLALVAVSLILTIVFGSCASSTTTTDEFGEERPAAPPFAGTTLSGESVSLSSFSGRPLVLVFWGIG